MNSAFRIKENLYIEVSQEKVFPVVPAGRTVPATWKQTFTTSIGDQRSFDLHFLRGISENLGDNTTLGKWRIGGIPPAPKGAHRITVEIRVGVDGSVGLRATLEDRPLPVTLLTDPFPKIPLTFRVPTIPLEKSISQPCPECKRSFVIRSANWKKEPFALCLDCGNEFELADTPVTGEKAPWEDLPPELIKTLGIEPPHTPGGLDADALRELQEKGFKLSDPESPDLAIRVDKVIQQVPGMIYRSSKKGDELSVDEILRLAGNPLPADQRRRCPKCDAVIAQDDKRCNWCGQTV